MTNTEISTDCKHCGQECEEEIVNDQGTFCCQGCSMVYDMLQSNNLHTYYELNKDAGVSMQGKEVGQKYAFLDQPDIREKLLLFSDGDLSKVRFYLPDIHCTSCLWLLEKLPHLQPLIKQSEVNYLRKEVTITFQESGLSLRLLAEMLARLGYAPTINLDTKAQRKGYGQSRKFLYKLGVTGFCFGNIMMSSFPEYLGLETMDQYAWVFTSINVGLSIPVLMYGAKDYLVSAWQAIKHNGVNIDVPISLGILAIYFQSMYEVFSGTGPGYFDSLASLVFLLLTGKWFQQKTFEQISFERDYKSYFPIATTRLSTDGSEESVSLEDLVAGDVILIRHGELIPADAYLLEGDAWIDNSFITGEADPKAYKIGDTIYAGGKQEGASLRLQVKKKVSQSYLTQLWNAPTFNKSKSDRLASVTDRLSRYFTWAILVIAFVSATYWAFEVGMPAAMKTFTSVLIIACPCALALNVPYALGNTMRFLARNGLFVKSTAVIEALNEIDTVVLDKTGTITLAGAIKWDGAVLTTEELRGVKSLVKQSTHPISRKITAAIKGKVFPVSAFQEVKGKGIEALVEGQMIRVGALSWLQSLVINGQEIPLLDQHFKSATYVMIGEEVKGAFIWDQDFRKGAEGFINFLKKHFRIALLSGDTEGESERMAKVFGAHVPLNFRQSPEKKLAYIKSEEEQGHKVLMMGDGLNDAGALQQSTVGVSVSDDVHSFSPACDAILQGDQIAMMPAILQSVKRSMAVVNFGFAFSFLYNIVGLFFAVQNELSPLLAAVLMPISSITVVGVGLLGTWLIRPQRA